MRVACDLEEVVTGFATPPAPVRDDPVAGRLRSLRAEAGGAGLRRFERILKELRPRGGPQERTHSLFLYLLRHGPGLAARLRESFDPFESGHYLVQL